MDEANIESISDDIMLDILQRIRTVEELVRLRTVSRRFHRLCPLALPRDDGRFIFFAIKNLLDKQIALQKIRENSFWGWLEWVSSFFCSKPIQPLVPPHKIQDAVPRLEHLLRSKALTALVLDTESSSYRASTYYLKCVFIGEALFKSLNPSIWKGLLRLRLGGLKLNVPGLAALSHFLKTDIGPQLKELDFGISLSWIGKSDDPHKREDLSVTEGRYHMEEILKSCTQLEFLTIHHCNFNCGFLTSASLTLKNLWYSNSRGPECGFDIGHNDMTAFWQQKRDQLYWVSLQLCGNVSKSLPSASSKVKKLTYLDLTVVDKTSIDQQPDRDLLIEALKGLADFKLKYLYLRGNFTSDQEDLLRIVNIWSSPPKRLRSSLTTLGFMWEVPSFGADVIDKLKRFPNLESINLTRHGSQINVSCIRRLLKRCKALHSLHLDETDIGDEILDLIGPYSTIHTLSLKSCRNVTLEGVKNLLQLRGLNSPAIRIYCYKSGVVKNDESILLEKNSNGRLVLNWDR